MKIIITEIQTVTEKHELEIHQDEVSSNIDEDELQEFLKNYADEHIMYWVFKERQCLDNYQASVELVDEKAEK